MAHEVSRRGAVKFAAALAVGASTAIANSALGQQPGPLTGAADAGQKKDELLALARHSIEGFMLSEPEIFILDTDGYSRDLVITSARDEKGDPITVQVRSRSVRVFRSDPAVDEFTSQGGLYWRFRDNLGKVKLKQTSGATSFNKHPHSGALVMVVREDETVRVYTLTLDLRC